MNALEKSSPKKEAPVLNNGEMFDLNFFTKESKEETNLQETKLNSPVKTPKPVTSNDDVMVDISTDVGTSYSINNNDSPLDSILDLGLDNKRNYDNDSPIASDSERKVNVKSKASDVRSLSDIDVTLQSVQPSKVAPLTALEEPGGITVVLHFCKDKPRPDVNVVVISTTSRNTSPIEDYKFQSVVPKVIYIFLDTIPRLSEM